MCDLSIVMSGSLALPTKRKGIVMFCSGIVNVQNDSTMSSSLALNSNATWWREYKAVTDTFVENKTVTHKKVKDHN